MGANNGDQWINWTPSHNIVSTWPTIRDLDARFQRLLRSWTSHNNLDFVISLAPLVVLAATGLHINRTHGLGLGVVASERRDAPSPTMDLARLVEVDVSQTGRAGLRP